MVVLLICGGGNGAHVYSGVAASQPRVESRVLTLYADEAQRWTDKMATDGFTINVNQQDVKYTLASKPSIVSKDPAKVVPGADIIVLVVPAFAHEQYLDALKPHIKPGVILVGLPGKGGLDFQVRGIWGDLALQCTIMSFETLPWACRIKQFGASAEVLGTKESIIGAVNKGSVPPSAGDATAIMQQTLGSQPRLLTSGHLLGIMPIGGYLHPTIMYGQWHNWDRQPVDSPPLFYQGLSQEAADIITAISDELLAVGKTIMKERPQIDLTNMSSIYEWYVRCYVDDITDKTSLYTCIHTNKAYKGLLHPCKQTTDGKFVPDFKYRYLTEDIPYGLTIMKGIALIVGVPTPNIDKVLLWAQEQLGEEYLVDGELKGKDLNKTRTPQRYGLNSLDTILGLA